MTISSNTLFHFTKDMNTLKLILSDMYFLPKYCEEYGWNIRFAVPMTCFCDIPLSQIGNHLKWYGNYGIGLAKGWGINKGVCPVFYVTKSTFSLLNTIIKDEETNNQVKICKIISRIKKVKGVNIRRTKNKCQKQHKNYIYYNEREWRYVPPMNNYKDLFLRIEENTSLKAANKRTEEEKYRLKFQISDIRYVFVATDADRIEMLKFINRMNCCTDDEKNLLKSKILIKEQLINDF